MDIDNLFEALDEKGFRTYAVTGGGGKTSLMFALGRCLAKRYKTLVTTTTKIKRPDAGECDSLEIGTISALADVVAKRCSPCLFASGAGYEGEKIVGHAPEEIDALVGTRVFDRVIVEADGSRGLSLKAYEKWEPPVPQSAGCHFVVIGADALTQPLLPSNVFRLEKLCERFKAKQGEKISINTLAAILSSKSEYLKNSPMGAYRILLLNKSELLSSSELNCVVFRLKAQLASYDLLVPASLKEQKVFDA